MSFLKTEHPFPGVGSGRLRFAAMACRMVKEGYWLEPCLETLEITLGWTIPPWTARYTDWERLSEDLDAEAYRLEVAHTEAWRRERAGAEQP